MSDSPKAGDSAVEAESDDEEESSSSCPEGEYEIKSILEHKTVYKKGRKRKGAKMISYFVSWKHFGPEDDCWIDEDEAENAKELIREYWDKVNKKTSADKSPAPEGNAAGVRKLKPKRRLKAILSHKIGDNDQVTYFVSWHGLGASHNSWIKEKDAKDACHLIRQYWTDFGSKEATKGRGLTERSSGASSAASGSETSRELGRHEGSKGSSLKGKNTEKSSSKSKSQGHSLPVRSPRSTTCSHLAKSKEFEATKRNRREKLQKSSTLHVQPNIEAEWENVVKHIEAIYELPDGRRVFTLVFTTGGRHTYDVAVANQRCPQKVIAFYESRVAFTPRPPSDK
ncbi:hypothetical protein CBS101457_000334 [Exobasidium rhododendri]|nr:hypothetical protein CBS101457_000334 [Exobasidium rhododendri]